MPRATRRGWFTALLATVVLLAAGCAGVRTTQRPPSAPRLGGGFSFDGDILGLPAAVRDADLDRAKAMGATWVRLPFNWATLQMHGPGTYNWGPADALVGAA